MVLVLFFDPFNPFQLHLFIFYLFLCRFMKLQNNVEKDLPVNHVVVSR